MSERLTDRRVDGDELNGLKLMYRQQQANRIKAAYVFINEHG
jgi:hypothetical protein